MRRKVDIVEVAYLSVQKVDPFRFLHADGTVAIADIDGDDDLFPVIFAHEGKVGVHASRLGIAAV